MGISMEYRQKFRIVMFKQKQIVHIHIADVNDLCNNVHIGKKI